MKKRLLYFLLLVGSVAFSLVLVELLLAVIKPKISYREWRENSLSYLLDDEVDWKLEPRTYQWGKVNRYNFRGNEIAPVRREGVCRVVVVGGSAAFDLWKTDDSTWPALLESKLNETLLQQVEVLNTGTPGYSSFQAYKLVKSKLVRWKPDLVLLYELFNDSLYFRMPNRASIIEGWKLNARANYIGPLAHPHPLLDIASTLLPRTIDILRMYGVQAQKAATAKKNDEFWQNPRRDSKLSDVGLGFYEENRRGLATFLGRNGMQFGIVSQASLLKEKNLPEEEPQIAYRYRGFNHAELWRAYQRARAIDQKIADDEANTFLIEADKMIPSTLSHFVDEVHLNGAGGELLSNIIAQELNARQLNPATRWCQDTKQ